ncbi:hypothetical protein PIB30_077060, partial [Stylosanthes scabra]|nr:hypothetical protein [Stylosanthes scabra]
MVKKEKLRWQWAPTRAGTCPSPPYLSLPRPSPSPIPVPILHFLTKWLRDATVKWTQSKRYTKMDPGHKYLDVVDMDDGGFGR